MPGIGFWVHYRMFSEYNRSLAKVVVPHYYVQNSKELVFSSLENLIQNPGFEEGFSNWEVISGSPGVKWYHRIGVETHHSEQDKPGSHGKRVLSFVKGKDEANVIRQRVSVKPGHVYSASAWINNLSFKKSATKGKFTITVFDAGGDSSSPIITKEITTAYGNEPWKVWNRIAATFVGPSSGSIIIELSDVNSYEKCQSLVDFVQLDDLGASTAWQ